MTDDKFNMVSFISAYEEGDLTEDEVIAGFQQLHDRGIVWSLQGSYQRAMKHYLETGQVVDRKRSYEDMKAGVGE